MWLSVSGPTYDKPNHHIVSMPLELVTQGFRCSAYWLLYLVETVKRYVVAGRTFVGYERDIQAAVVILQKWN